MLSKIQVEAVPETEVPAGRGRPGPVLPNGLMESVAKSANDGVWLSAKFETCDEAEELVKLLHYIHRSTRYPYNVATRREETADGPRILFKAEANEAERND